MWRHLPRRLSLTLAALLLANCTDQKPSEVDLYAAALGSLRTAFEDMDFSTISDTTSIPVHEQAIRVVDDVSAPGSRPEHFEPGSVALAQFVDTAKGWSLCTAPPEKGCLVGRPGSALSISLPVLGEDDSTVTLWATFNRTFPPGGFMDWEGSYWKVSLHRINGVWVADTAVFIAAEP